ncbi:MAG: PadR family transcriptional regulator [Rhizobiaceae bacterium]|nr:PadR family transcriptional regulator [Rhizobiaceae bacterium]
MIYINLLYDEKEYAVPNEVGAIARRMMNINTLILAILNVQDATGYEIKKLSTDGQFSYFVDISFGSIYPTLARLDKEGKVTLRTETQSGKPDRKIYSITDAGRMEFIAALAQPPAPDKFKSEFLLLAINAGLQPVDVIRNAIDARIEYITGTMEKIENFMANCGNETTAWVGKYGHHCMKCDLDYLIKNRSMLIGLAGGLMNNPTAEAAE